MNTLREICEFVGASGGNKYVASPNAINAHNPDPGLGRVGELVPSASMRFIGLMAPVLSVGERTSMRAMIQRLPTLSPISLDVDTGNLSDDRAFRPAIQVHASDGVIHAIELLGEEDGARAAFAAAADYAVAAGEADGEIELSFGAGAGSGVASRGQKSISSA